MTAATAVFRPRVIGEKIMSKLGQVIESVEKYNQFVVD
jgi:hypothetical protein